MTTGKNIDLLVAANQVHIAYGGDHIQLQSIGNDPYLYLSPLLKRLSHRAILKIDIDDSVGRVFPGGVAIFFQWARASHFSSGFEVADGGGCLI